MDRYTQKKFNLAVLLYGVPNDKGTKKKFKKAFKYKQGKPKHSEPLTIEPRFIFDEEFPEYFSEVGFLPFKADENTTEAEIIEYYEENMERKIYSMYDCTGKTFSCGFKYHINPNGMISYRHDMGIDI